MRQLGRRRGTVVTTARAASGVAVPLLAILLGVPAASAAEAPKPGELRGASIAQAGWWSRVNQEPPENPLVAPPGPPAPGAPAGSLPVAVTAGEPQRLSAIEFAPQGQPDAEVTAFVISMKENGERGSQLNPDAAAVLACPVTESFFVAGDNGRWQNQPTYDCEDGAVKGVRGADGVWVFDLTPLAADWLASDRSTAPAVVLAPVIADEESRPRSFQVVFDGPKANGVGVRATSDADKAGGSGGSDPSPSDGEGAAPASGSGSAPGGGSLGGSAVGGGLDAGALGAAPDAGVVPPDAGVTAGTPPASGAPAAETAETAATDSTPVAASSPPWHSGIPRLGLLLVPLALGLAYLAMVAMGPDAQPTAQLRRHGVSRALDRMRTLGQLGGQLGGQLRAQIPTGLRARSSR